MLYPEYIESSVCGLEGGAGDSIQIVASSSVPRLASRQRESRGTDKTTETVTTRRKLLGPFAGLTPAHGVPSLM